jgi:hypothetical protein
MRQAAHTSRVGSPIKGGIQRSGTHVQIGKFGCDMFQRGYEEGRQDAVIKKELMRKIEELEKKVF